MKSGIYTPGFEYDIEVVDKATGRVKDVIRGCNLIPAAGVEFLIQAPFGDASPVGSFYMGLFANDYVPTAPVKAVDIPSVLGEFTNYSEAARPLWNRIFDGTSAQSNTGSRAIFTPTVARRIYGCFLVSSSTKGGNTGMLLSVMRFPNPKDVEVGEELRGLAGITYVAANTY